MLMRLPKLNAASRALLVCPPPLGRLACLPQRAWPPPQRAEAPPMPDRLPSFDFCDAASLLRCPAARLHAPRRHADAWQGCAEARAPLGLLALALAIVGRLDTLRCVVASAKDLHGARAHARRRQACPSYAGSSRRTLWRCAPRAQFRRSCGYRVCLLASAWPLLMCSSPSTHHNRNSLPWPLMRAARRGRC